MGPRPLWLKHIEERHDGSGCGEFLATHRIHILIRLRRYGPEHESAMHQRGCDHLPLRGAPLTLACDNRDTQQEDMRPSHALGSIEISSGPENASHQGNKSDTTHYTTPSIGHKSRNCGQTCNVPSFHAISALHSITISTHLS